MVLNFFHLVWKTFFENVWEHWTGFFENVWENAFFENVWEHWTDGTCAKTFEKPCLHHRCRSRQKFGGAKDFSANFPKLARFRAL